jgi:hypothetical protein
MASSVPLVSAPGGGFYCETRSRGRNEQEREEREGPQIEVTDLLNGATESTK